MAPTGQKQREEARAKRLRAALRENLKRRKVQAKGRASGTIEAKTAESLNSAGIADEDTRD